MSQNPAEVTLSQFVDYGARAKEEAAKNPGEGDPLLATPELDALLELLAQDNHDVSRVVAERDRVKSTLNVHLTVHRSLARQVASVESSHAAILAGRS